LQRNRRSDRKVTGKKETQKGQGSDKTDRSDIDLERIHRERARRHERMTTDILELFKHPKYKYLAQELLNLKRALETREKILEAREKAISGKVTDLELQKKRLSKQAAKLAKLKNELEHKITELEGRLKKIKKTK